MFLTIEENILLSVIQKEASICSYQVLLEALDFILKKKVQIALWHKHVKILGFHLKKPLKEVGLKTKHWFT
jgi:hypothetical protein